MMRSKIPYLLMMASCAVWLTACGDDDGSATGDGTETETEGDDDGDDDAPDDDDGDPTSLTDPTDPDSEDGGTTDDDGETTTPTTADESSSSGEPCLIPMEIFADASFEDGGGWPSWGQASTNFGTPLCSEEACGQAGASDGALFAWFGGTEFEEIGGLAQTVIIEETDQLTFSFDFWIAASSGFVEDRFYVTIDGNEVFSVTAVDPGYEEYVTVEIDVSEYADGGEHEFEFISITWGGDPVTNFFMDNLQMGTCGGGEAVTVTDSVTGVDPTMGPETTGEDTGGEDPVEMCDEDIGSTVPFTQDGDNSGQGDDSLGSCTDGDGGEDYVYSWTAPANGVYRFDTADSVADTVLYLYDACMDGSEIACNDDVDLDNDVFSSAVTVSLVQDQLVAIVVDSYAAGSEGAFTLNITQVACDAPTDLGNDVPVAQAGNNEGAGDGITATCATASGGEDVTYSWTAPESALYEFDTTGSSFDTVLAGFIGTCGDPAVQIGCSNNGTMSSFVGAVDAGAEVTVVVDGAAPGEEGDFDLAITQVGLLEGDCCATDDSGGCEQGVTTNCVCGFIPECCTGEWSEVCVGLAGSQCGAGCEPVAGGTCCDAMDGVGGCDTVAIEACVCAFDGFCCETEWDQTCVDEGVEFCNADCA